MFFIGGVKTGDFGPIVRKHKIIREIRVIRVQQKTSVVTHKTLSVKSVLSVFNKKNITGHTMKEG